MSVFPEITNLWLAGAIISAAYGVLILILRAQSFDFFLALFWLLGQTSKAIGCLILANHHDATIWHVPIALFLYGYAIDFLCATFLLRNEWRLRTTFFLLLLAVVGLSASATSPEHADKFLALTASSGLFIFPFLTALAASDGPAVRSKSQVSLAIINYFITIPAFFVLLAQASSQVLELFSFINIRTYVDFISFALPILLAHAIIQSTAIYILASKRARARREHLRSLDLRTGALNNYGFSKASGKIRAICRRLDQETSLVVLKVDGYEKFEKTIDRKTRDRLFSDLVSALKYCLRKHDHVARLAENDFAVLLPFTDVRRALLVCDRLRNQIDRDVTVFHNDQEYAISVSFGVTDVPDMEPDMSDAIDRAGRALERAGKGGCEVQGSGIVSLPTRTASS